MPENENNEENENLIVLPPPPDQTMEEKTEETPQSNFNIDDEVASLKSKPKQNSNRFANVEYAETVKPSDYDEEEEEEEIEDHTETAEEVDGGYYENENSERNARLIFGFFNRIFATLLSWWALEKDSDQFKAEKQSAKDIQESLSDYFKTIPDFKFPAWLGLTSELLMAYGKKIKLAFKKRKFNKEARKQAKKNQSPHQNPRRYPRKAQEPTHNPSQEVTQEPIHEKNDNQCEAFGCKNDKGKNKVYCSEECRTNMMAHRNREKGKQ